ncbi:hypothetical protein, partial [Solemya velum gill symbiont]
MSEATETEQTEEPEKKKKRRIPLFVWVILAVLIWVVVFVWLTDRKVEQQQEAAQAPAVEEQQAET